MKLLLDQNLSFRLVVELRDYYRDVSHVRDFGLSEADDAIVWQFAVREGFVIVSKDADFHQRSFVLGAPPKIVWLRVGNCSTARIANLLLKSKAEIEQFVEQDAAAFLVMD